MARRRLLFSYFYLTYNGNKYGETVNVSSFSEDGGTDSFSVTSSKEWNIVSSPSWITASVTSGGKGETSVTLTASVNEGTSEKTGSIVIKTVDDRYTATLYVTQDGIVPYIRINNNDADVNENVAFRSTISSYTIKSRGGWTLAITGGTTNVTAITDTNVVETALTINYPKNTDTGSSKTIKIVLTNTSDSTIKRTITLTQAAQSYITFTRNGADANVIPYNGEVGSILVKTNDIGYAFEESSQFELSKTLGLNNNETISYTAQTLTTANTATTVSISVTAKTSDYDASDNIDQKVYTYQYELYPYLNVANVNVSSASTTGSTTYSSNYNVINATPASQGITNIVVNNGNVTFTLPEPSWNDETYTLNLQTTGTVGPGLSTTATITRPAKVAYLNTSNITVSKNAGDPTNNIIGAIDTNDTYTLDVTSGSDWLTYNPTTGTFSMTENTGTEDRTATITVTTTHNGSNGSPIVKTITVTQEAIPTVEQNITVNLDMKQNNGGTWYIKTSTSNSSLNFPITISYGGNQFNTTVNNGNFVQTPFTTAVGTQINTTNISGTPSYLDADAHIRYNITYVMPTNVAYTETVQSLVPTSVELTYSDTDFLANGNASTTSQYSTPSNFVINYNEIIANSFDNTTRTVAKTESGLNHITSLDVTTSNGGAVNGTYNIGAASRGTTTGNSQTVAVIDKVNYTFSGQTYTYDIPNITFTQEANVAGAPVYVSGETNSTVTNTDIQSFYQDIGITTATTGGTSFTAKGTNTNAGYSGNNYIQARATETGHTYDITTTTLSVTGTSAFTITYTSGEHTDSITSNTWTDTNVVTGSVTTYSQKAQYSGSSQSWLSYNNSNEHATAQNRGIVTGNTRSGLLYFYAEHDNSIKVNIQFSQNQNKLESWTKTAEYEVSRTFVSAVTNSTSEEYRNISIDITASETDFKANGHTLNDNSTISVSATETGEKCITSSVTSTYEVEMGYDWIDYYTSEASGTSTTYDTDYVHIDETITGDWVSFSENNTNITTGTSVGNSLYYDDSSQRVVANHLEDTITQQQSLELIATATHDSNVSDSITIYQEANQIVETGRTEPLSCSLDVYPSSYTFKPGQMQALVSVTSTTNYYVYSAYTSTYSAQTEMISATEPNGDWQNGNSGITVSLNSHTGSTYTYEFGADLPSGSVSGVKDYGTYVFSTPNGTCTDSIDFYYSGASQEIIYPTLTPSFYSPQGGFWGINLNFDTSEATTGVQWSCSVDYQVTITEGSNLPETYRASFYMTGHCDEFGKIEVDDYDDGEGGTTISQVKVEGWTTVFVRSSRVLSQTASMQEDDINITQQPN